MSIDILLINVPTIKNYKKDFANMCSMPPLGIMYIASNLQNFNYSVEIIDMAVDFFDKIKFKNLILSKNPKIVGISSYVESWGAIKSITAFIKKIIPKTIIIAGGPFATFCPKEILFKTYTDYIIFGEGEYTFLDLTNSILRKTKEIYDVKGIGFIKDNVFIKTKANERIKNLDSLRFPNRDLINLNRYAYPITISTARGCPGNCIFCSSKSFWGKKIYFRSPENIIEEIKFIYKKYNKYNMFFIIDDTFTINPNRAIKFCDLLDKLDSKFIWGCESRADIINKELLSRLYKSGCRKIQFGMESANNDILKKLKKNVTIEQIEKAVKIASQLGFDINISFIIGHAFDTHETVKETLKFALKLREKFNVSLFPSINTPFPGTEIYKFKNKYEIEILTTDWNQYTMDNAVINTRNLTAFDIRKYYQTFIDFLLGRSEKQSIYNLK